MRSMGQPTDVQRRQHGGYVSTAVSAIWMVSRSHIAVRMMSRDHSRSTAHAEALW